MIMKTLKVLRVVFAFLTLFFFLMFLIPMLREDYSWMMITILVLFIVLIPTALISSIKMEKFPKMLPSKGVLKFNIIFSTVMIVALAVASVLRILNDLIPWMWVAGIFVFAYQLVNNLIIYRLKIQTDEVEA